MPQIIISPNPSALALAAHEFAIPCERQTPSCTGQAQWVARSTHGLHCPQEGAVCGVCKAYLEAYWAETLLLGSYSCANCHAPLIGMVPDHLSFIAL